MSDFLMIDDATKICINLLHETNYFDGMSKEEYESTPEFIRNEFEQKTWISAHNDGPVVELNNLIFEIHPDVIAEQIKKDRLRSWCQEMQAGMRLAMIDLPLKVPEEG